MMASLYQLGSRTGSLYRTDNSRLRRSQAGAMSTTGARGAGMSDGQTELLRRGLLIRVQRHEAIERQVPQSEQTRVIFDPRHTRLISFRTQHALAGEADKTSSCLQDEEHAREEFSALGFPGQSLPACLFQ